MIKKYAITESNPAVRQLSGVMAILRIFSNMLASKKLPPWQEVAVCYGAASRLPLIVEY
jgi:hypothetical protein